MKRWFGPKMIGYGIGPRSWDGWLVTLVFAAGGIVLARWLHPLMPKISLWTIELPWLALFFMIMLLTYKRNSEE